MFGEFRNARNWVDLFRALVAGWAISHLCFDLVPDAGKAADTTIFVLQAVIFVVAVLIQTLRHGQAGNHSDERFTLVAPVFFLLGLSFALIGWKAALFACAAGLILNQVLPNPGLLLLLFAILEFVFGMMLPGASFILIVLGTSLAIMPVLLSAMTKRSLVWLNKSQNKPM